MKFVQKVLLVMLIILVGLVYADRKSFVWTYEYMTMPKGATELEFYHTNEYNGLNQWEYEIEIEHGLTSRWDIGVYQIFSQKEKENLNWRAVQFRTRYRFGEVNQYFMDPTLYLEYNRKLDSSEPHKLEGKIILAKTYPGINFAINPVYEYYFGTETKHELGLDAGISKRITKNIGLGLESSSRLEFEDDEIETGSYFGPTLSIFSGKWYLNIGNTWGLTSHSDSFRTRFIMGILL